MGRQRNKQLAVVTSFFHSISSADLYFFSGPMKIEFKICTYLSQKRWELTMWVSWVLFLRSIILSVDTQDLSIKYTAMHYEKQRHFLRKKQDTRNNDASVPFKQAPWDLTQFSQCHWSWFETSLQQLQHDVPSALVAEAAE